MSDKVHDSSGVPRGTGGPPGSEGSRKPFEDLTAGRATQNEHGIHQLSPLMERRLRERALFADVRLLAAVSCGGVLGALARYGLGVAFPHEAGGFAWAILGINASGSLLIGVIAVLIGASPNAPRLLRPFAVTGVLGGYTTFSTYIVDIQKSLVAGAPRTALEYAAGTLIIALAAAWAGMRLGSAIVARAPAAPASSQDREGAAPGQAMADATRSEGSDAEPAKAVESVDSVEAVDRGEAS